MRTPPPNLDNISEVAAPDIVVGLEEHLAKAGLPHRVVLGVELIKPEQ